ncbi:hypothetical protein [Xylanimonas ulmi]|uniref:Uncharacterized protein n=1 Tax=Xylanimonas ulmi TaxID=228973 RepID=A0A4Q7M435_9MICO|nr:hypothetical protein [Xylanibacterium ulmi]RZS61657.1 hypothetical protein EV386_1967 [Xylanibacterium ulmi]
MSTTPETPDDATEVTDLDDTVALEQLVLEDAKLAEAEAAIKERRTQIRAVLATRFDVGTHDLAGRKVVVTRPGRLDAKAVEADFPVAAYPQLYAAALDTKAVRANLAPALIDEKYTARGAKTVTIK